MASVSELVSRALDQLGACPRCMKSAFASALAATAVAAAATALLPPLAYGAAWLAAALLTALWAAHVGMYTHRLLVFEAAQSDPVERRPSGRRRFLESFVAVAVVSLSIEVIPGVARADDCDCPPEFPKCNYNPLRKEAICCGPRTVPCQSEKKTWCCPPDQGCTDDDGSCG